MWMWSTGINRNIVECKAFPRPLTQELPVVLIETLWNVKSGTRAVITSSAVVLIETLWNVKNTITKPGSYFYTY